MLRVFAKPSRPEDHEAVFLSRYGQVLTWARQLTKGNAAEAEDLVQDAFLDFTHSRPDLLAVKNLDAFLYTIVRNIHRSQLQRHLRRRNLLLAAVDYDSADLGLRAAAPARILEIREQLHRVCQFACERKRTSKAGSLLILRFFHGYYPAEIAAITRWDRATVDARLGLVRREARAYVEGPDRLRSMDGAAEPIPARHPAGLESEAVLAELRSRIFAAVDGDCLPKSAIRELYRSQDSEGPSRGFLSHLVSCPGCLDVVNELLDLDASSDRGFGESDGPQTPNLTPITSPGKKARASRRQLGKWRRSALGIFEHYPRELMIVVNGSPRAWQTVSAGRNEFSVRLPQNELVDFVEIYSEQDVRLLSLAVPGHPPEVSWELRNETPLSNHRTLSVSLRLETLGPEVQVSYLDPVCAVAPAPAPTTAFRAPLVQGWRDRFRPQLAVWAIALALLLVLLLQPVRETTASAATLLMNTQTQERSAATQPGLVVHRSLSLEERPQGHPEVLSRRRVEVWRDGRRDMRIRRLFDEGGALLASSSETNAARPASPADVWKYEPSAENFELLAGDLSKVRVAAGEGSVRLTVAAAGLTIRQDNWHAIAGFVVLDGREYRFTETAFELIRSESSPWAPPPSETRREAPGELPHVETLAPRVDLASIELDCRYALHRIGADVGSSIEIRSSGDSGLVVGGVVPSEERRQEIERALLHVPGVSLELKTEDELALEALPPVRDHGEIRVVSARSPIEDQLLRYFGQPAEVERFTQAALAANEKLMAHAWALRRLAERYPGLPAGGALSPASRRKLEEMFSDHQRAMSASLREIAGLVEPVLSTLADSPGAAAPSGTVFDSAHQIEQRMLALLTGSGPGGPAPSQPGVAARELLDALRNLRGQLGDVP